MAKRNRSIKRRQVAVSGRPLDALETMLSAFTNPYSPLYHDTRFYRSVIQRHYTSDEISFMKEKLGIKREVKSVIRKSRGRGDGDRSPHAAYDRAGLEGSDLDMGSG